MIVHKPTGKTFRTRKEAKIYFGTSDYNKLCRSNEIIFTNENSSANYESNQKSTI